MERIFIDEKTGNYYGVKNNEDFNSFEIGILADDGVLITNYVEKAADYIKEIFNDLSTINKLKLFLFVEKKTYFFPETMVSLMDEYADEWRDDDVTSLEFVSKNQKEFLSWAEDYVDGSFSYSFDPSYCELLETLEYISSIEKNFRYRTITGCSQGEIYYCLKLISNESIEDKKFFDKLFASDYLYSVCCESWITFYKSNSGGDFIEAILDIVGYVEDNGGYIGTEEIDIDSYMEKEFNARPAKAKIEYV